MTNCAYRLAEVLLKLTVPPSQPPEVTRGFRRVDDLDAWRRQSEVADLMRTVDSTLQGMDAAGLNVEMFIVALPRWYAGVYFASTPWASQMSTTRPACADGDINLLMALGLTLDTMKPVQLSEENRRSLTDVLSEARRLLEEDSDSIPDDVRSYLWSLIIRAEMIANDLQRYGTEAVRQVAFELGGAMTAQAVRVDSRGDGDRAKRWGATALHLVSMFVGSSAAGALGNIAAAPIVGQITGTQ